MREVGACAEGERSVRVPLGRPLRNVRAYVLDWSGEPAPVGVSGELYLGGEGVGRGYVNEAQWTAERFVPDPFSGVDGGRMYRTGDQVRWSEEGELEFLGRVDQQVKIRGYRIEPGEIEAVLREHAGVKQSAVVAQETEGGEKQLIGYVGGGEAAGRLSAEQVREYLAGRLPDYMVPGRIVVVTELPLTANGKLDRQALLKQEIAWPGIAEKLQPRDSTELFLKHIWEDVLNLSNIGINENFFALGGHSLTAVSLTARLAKVYGAKISVRTIFDNPTVEQLGCFVRREISWAPPSSVIPFNLRGAKIPFFCVHPAGGIANCYLDLARHLGSNQPFYGLQAYGLDEQQRALTSIEEIASVYIKDIRVVQPKGPYQVGGWSLGATIAYEIAQQLMSTGERVRLLVIMDAMPSFNRVEEPLTDEIVLQLKRERLLTALKEAGIEEGRIDSAGLVDLAASYLSWGKDRGAFPPDVTVEQFLRFIHVWVANEAAAKRYIFRRYPGRITLFRSGITEYADENYGWGQLAVRGVDVYKFAETHIKFVTEPNSGLLALQLEKCIEEAIDEGYADASNAPSWPSRYHGEAHGLDRAGRFFGVSGCD
jgi:thioesterase domain-containing protein